MAEFPHLLYFGLKLSCDLGDSRTPLYSYPSLTRSHFSWGWTRIVSHFVAMYECKDGWINIGNQIYDIMRHLSVDFHELSRQFRPGAESRSTLLRANSWKLSVVRFSLWERVRSHISLAPSAVNKGINPEMLRLFAIFLGLVRALECRWPQTVWWRQNSGSCRECQIVSIFV